ncbi:hypothetical protein [Microbulbifer sp. TYP-18]|uniref:portal protein n=1 Tax=Microbulbifer sp. TYP-18 TaxID=3230024 RepID=UPI0034C6A7E4
MGEVALRDDPQVKGGLPLYKLERFLSDIAYQPNWRSEADRACAYYDGNQLTPEQQAKMRELGQPLLIHNLMAPAIDGVLGLEARTRADLIVRADDEDSMEVAEALNERFNEAARLVRLDRACADAFAGQVKAGLDWVEVSRTSDPFGPAYRCHKVHRNEIWWDWHSVQPDLSDARWLVRRRWVDRDEAIMAFPAHEDMIQYATNGWENFDTDLHLMNRPDLVGAYSDYTDTELHYEDWWDSNRDRTLIYEVYYRQYVRRPVFFTPDGRVIEADPKNKWHQAVIASGKVQVQTMAFPKIRLAYFIGPHRLVDVDSPHPHNHFPYVPFWGFREDSTNVPYGLGRRMLPAQDEINLRRQRLTRQLNSRLVVKDEDAIANMSEEEVMDEIYRLDGIINLNKNRQNKDIRGFEIITEDSIAQQQFSVMQEAQKVIQDVAGVYSAFLGQDSSAASGVAINSLVEQGSTTLAELTDNFRYARNQVAELLLAHIVEDLADQPNVEVKTNVGKPDKSKVIRLNAVDADNRPATNVVTKAKLHVVLGDITSTPGYRAQVTQRMMELASSLPPDMQVIMLDLIVESTDLPNRDKIVARIREATGRGLDPEEMTQAQRAQMQQAQQFEQAMQQLGMAEAQEKVRKLSAEAAKLEAQAGTEQGKARMSDSQLHHLDMQTEKLIAELKSIIADVALKRSQLRFQQVGDSPITA